MTKLTHCEVSDQLQDTFEFDGQTPDEVIAQIEKLKRRCAAKGAIPDSIKFDYQYYGHNGEYEIAITFKRLETDAELAWRQAREDKLTAQAAKRKAKKDEDDRKTYERLRKKFGDG